MEEKKMEIVKSALEVYMKFGIKSVTMDEMARQLGVSKKTLYIHVRDKNELVEQCLLLDHFCAIEGMDFIFAQGLNAIEELLEIGRYMVKTLGAIHPSIFFDLAKYHPSALKSAQKHKYDAMRERIVNNLNKGMAEGVYRDNLTPGILSRLHMGTIDMIMSSEAVPSNEFRVDEVYSEFFRYHIRGIASKKGLECLKELIHNDENL